MVCDLSWNTATSCWLVSRVGKGQQMTLRIQGEEKHAETKRMETCCHATNHVNRFEASRFHDSGLQKSTADISGPKVLHKQHLSFSRFYTSAAWVYANDGTTGSTITCFRSRLPGNRYDIQGKQMNHCGWGWNR